MRGGITRRFALLLALIGVLGSGLTGYYTYSASRKLLVEGAQTQLLTATQVLGRRITESLENTNRDLQLLAGYPESAVLLKPNSALELKDAEDDLTKLSMQMLKVHPQYFQVRLISAAEHGKERVRIDRDGSGLLSIKGNDLQEKGHFPYVFETLRLPQHATYLSHAAINHEHGAHAGEGRPALQLATPVFAPNADQALGLVVVNVDLHGLYELLVTDLPADFQVYLSNHEGDFLIHPDPAQAFAFDRGQHVRVQDQFAGTEALVAGASDHLVTTVTPAHGEALIAAFIRLEHWKSPGEKYYSILGLAQPLRSVLAQSDALGAVIMRIVLAFSAIATVLAIVLTRTFTRPLKMMVGAVERFAKDHSVEPLPVERHDEIGVLARSFDGMQRQIAAQVLALRESQKELDFLASHDSLTGLPNRRLFYDRLEQALARARRHEEPMALLFIDLDHFKEINDSFGHSVGDIVLREAARNIRLVVREIDTVARLGGDEFVVLLDSAASTEDVANVAQKIIAALTPPIVHGNASFQIGASIGISLYPEHGTTAAELITSADQAMYRAKGGGRNRYCFADLKPLEN